MVVVMVVGPNIFFIFFIKSHLMCFLKLRNVLFGFKIHNDYIQLLCSARVFLSDEK